MKPLSCAEASRPSGVKFKKMKVYSTKEDIKRESKAYRDYMGKHPRFKLK